MNYKKRSDFIPSNCEILLKPSCVKYYLSNIKPCRTHNILHDLAINGGRCHYYLFAHF